MGQGLFPDLVLYIISRYIAQDSLDDIHEDVYGREVVSEIKDIGPLEY